MKKFLFIGILFIVGCGPAGDVDPYTGGRITQEKSLTAGVYELTHKNHTIIYSTMGGMMHAPYCECFNQVTLKQ